MIKLNKLPKNLDLWIYKIYKSKDFASILLDVTDNGTQIGMDAVLNSHTEENRINII